MRLSRLGPLLLLLFMAESASAQEPPPPAPEPAPPPEPPPRIVVEPAPAPEPEPESEPAPAPEAPPPEPASTTRAEPAPIVGSKLPAPGQPAPPPWARASSPLTLEGRLGFSIRPQSSGGFDDESQLGAELGLSLYIDLMRELAAGLEVDRVGLGRGTAITRLDSVTVDYTVTSALLGLRAYPKRTELFDVFVGLQVGVGIQGVSAAGTRSNGSLSSAVVYSCAGSDTPDFQLGGGVGARLMLTPRWGVTARVNGTGRRLTSDLVDDCAQGIGTATTVSGSIGLGYDFDLDP